MGFWTRLTTGLLNTLPVQKASLEANSTRNANKEDKDKDAVDLWDSIPFRINRTIPNYRYAFKYDSTVNATINNLLIVANNKFDIVADSEEYEKDAQHIRDKVKEWNLPQYIDTFIKRNMVDGSMFTNRYIVKEKGRRTLKLKVLANDGEDFKWLVIRDPDTEEIMQYKQRALKKKLPSNWRTAEYDEMDKGEEEYTTIPFEPEEIIYSTWMEEDGQGMSALYPILDLIDIKGKLELFMLLSGHKAGAFLGLKIGNENVDASNVDSTFINEIMDWFSESRKKDVIAYPDGIDPELIGNTNLPDYVTFLKYLESRIRNAIMTPDSKFSAVSSNRATAKEQLNTSTGYQGFIEYLQEFIMWYINNEIIDKELELFNENAVGKVKLVYNNEDLEDETELSDTGTKLKNAYPDLNAEAVIRAYFPRYARLIDSYKKIYGDEWEKKLDADMGKMDMSGASDDWNKEGMNSYNVTMKQNADKRKKKRVEQITGKDVYKEV